MSPPRTWQGTNQDWWEHRYEKNRYLESASNDQLKARFREIYGHMMGLNDRGQITLGEINHETGSIFVVWAHFLYELRLRNIPFPTFAKDVGTEEFLRPTHPKPPRGIEIREITQKLKTPFLIKYGKREHLRSAYSQGEFLVSNAKYYSDPSLNSEIKDDELNLNFFVPSKRVRIQDTGNDGIDNIITPIGDINRQISLGRDYYAMCFSYDHIFRQCESLDYDSAIIIYDIYRFSNRLTKAVSKKFGYVEVAAAPVEYFDPYLSDPSQYIVPFAKNYRYQYQREFRFVWYAEEPLERISIRLGPLREISHFVRFEAHK